MSFTNNNKNVPNFGQNMSNAVRVNLTSQN